MTETRFFCQESSVKVMVIILRVCSCSCYKQEALALKVAQSLRVDGGAAFFLAVMRTEQCHKR